MRAPNSSRTDTEKVRGGFHNLFQWEDPHTPGLPLATHVDPSKVNDKISSEAEAEAEVESVVHYLHPHRAGGHTHLCVEYFK